MLAIMIAAYYIDGPHQQVWVCVSVLGLGNNMISSYIMISSGHDNCIVVIFKISYYRDRQYIVFCVEIELLFM